MTQEDKQLLLTDLCGRLPYGVKVRGVFLNYNKDKDKILYEYCDNKMRWEDLNRFETLKPHLRAMADMTEDEKKEFVEYAGYDLEETINGRHYEYYWHAYCGDVESPKANYWGVDWLNQHHFDYRGLIEKGLAIRVTNENNPYKSN